ncbi:MAG: hypothetical protein ABW221_06380 [Vicinamibacteria bacterium]
MILAVSTAVLGVGVEAALARLAGRGDEPLDCGIVALLGLAALTTLCAFLSLARPMDGASVLGILAIVAASAFLRRRELGARWRAVLRETAARPAADLWLAAAVVACALAWACVPSLSYDGGVYHGQATRWAERFAVVPGLGNLELRLGLVPTWFVMSAATSGWFAGERIVALNSFVFLCVAFYLWNGWPRLRLAPRSVSAWLRVLAIPGALLVANEWLSHVTPDLPVAVLWFALLGMAVEEIEAGSTGELRVGALALGTLAFFAVSIRMSAAPALLLAGYVGWTSPRRRRALLALLGISAILALPVLLRNTVQTGHPLMPLSWPGGFGFDWTIPEAVMQQARLGIRGTPDRVRLEWPDRVALPIVALAGVVALLPLRLPTLRRFRTLFAGGLVALAFWGLTAPDPRFGRGLYLPLALVVAICLAVGWTEKSPHPPRRGAVAVATALVTLVTVYDLIRAGRQVPPGAWVRAPAPPQFATTSAPVGTLVVERPAQPQDCWYEPFPCSTLTYPIEARGTSFGDGFRSALEPGLRP